MVAIVKPEVCTRCGLRRKELSIILLPPFGIKKKKNKLVIPYTPSVYLCKKCLKLLYWIMNNNIKDILQMYFIGILMWIVILVAVGLTKVLVTVLKI